MVSPKEKIKAWRRSLGLSDLEVAHAIGATISSYYDIELHEDEIFQVTPLAQVKGLCQVLQRSFWDLFALPCEFCSHATQFSTEYILPRNELVRARRLAKGWSTAELGDRIGFLPDAVEGMEADPNYLESWSFNLVKELAATLDLPLQVLLGVKCRQCGR